MSGLPDRFSWVRTLGWAAFLGCSWTWCIGMFLPVLLVRDLGVWGWVVFAAPNVVGAAAMGWVLASPEVSRGIVDRHEGACVAFSGLTIAFHVFFVLWFVPRLVGLPMAACALALAGVYLLFSIRRPGWDRGTAGFVWLVSLAMFALFMVRGPRVQVPVAGELAGINALWLAPVCIFGFALCPYLDLTFHRARQQTAGAEARIAFGAGFGICFLMMIVFSLLYAAALSPLLGPGWRGHLRPVFGGILAVHMIVQAAFTLAVHSRALAASRIGPGGLLGFIVLTQAALLIGLAANLLPRYHGMDAGELVYRLFMAFYGLAAPAYVWIRMVPRRGPTDAAANTRALLLGMIVAAPMYWMGFIEGRMIWLVPGVAAVVLARYAAPVMCRRIEAPARRV